MQPQDFLHQSAPTPLRKYFAAAGAVFSFSTNCEQMLEAARASFMAVEPSGSADFSVRFWADDALLSRPPWPNPYVRGLGHLVFAGFDGASSILADLQTRRVIGRFSAAMAADTAHWRMVIFPVLLSIVAGSVGLVELHASCVARGQQGLLLLGPSRSGKSTLAMALTRAGFRLLSDDRTFCSLTRDELQAWGLPRPLKLRREAAQWFEDYRDREPTDVQNGEFVFHCEPDQQSARPHSQKCKPRLLVFLEQQQTCGFSMMPIGSSEARFRIEQDLLAESTDAVRKQSETLDQLLSVPCRILRYGGSPQLIAEQLAAAFLDMCEVATAGETT
jgi:hypothetical protein